MTISLRFFHVPIVIIKINMTPRIRKLMAICLTNWLNKRLFFYQAKLLLNFSQENDESQFIALQELKIWKLIQPKLS